MQVSPIQLRFYFLSRLIVLPGEPVGINPPVAGGELFNWSGVNIQTNIEFGWGDQPSDESRPFALRLGLVVDNKAGVQAPYTFDIETVGYFDLIGDAGQANDAQDLAQVNGAAMLYGAMREMLISSTVRFPRGPVVLPGVNFLDLKHSVSPVVNGVAEKTAN